MTELEQQLMRRVIDAIRDLAAGRTTFDQLTLSTTEKLTVALALDLPVSKFCGTEKGAWEHLNVLQRRTVATYNPRYNAKEWKQIPVYFA